MRYLAPAELTPWSRNPRSITKAELKELQSSIDQFGFVQPVVFNTRTRTLVAGHQRVAAAQALGLEKIPAVFVNLDERMAAVLAISLNKIGGTWDVGRLGELLREIQEAPDIDVRLTGFSDKEIGQLLGELERQAMPAPFEETAAGAFDLQRQHAPTRVKPGESWRLGRHLLHCGDCLQEGLLTHLLDGRPVGYAVTDPPYGISFTSAARPGRRKAPIQNDDAERYQEFIGKVIPMLRSVMAPGGVMHLFCGASGPRPVLAHTLLAVAEHFDLQGLLIWDRVDPGLGWRWRKSFEGIIEASVGKPRVWGGGRESRDILRYPRAIPPADAHPTPKPIGLLEHLIRAAAPSGATILDPFVGSGSTIIAAERTNRTCVAVEIEARYCDLALSRFEAMTGVRPTRVDGNGEAAS